MVEYDDLSKAQIEEHAYRLSKDADLVESEARTILLRTGLDITEVYNALNALRVAGISLNKET